MRSLLFLGLLFLLVTVQSAWINHLCWGTVKPDICLVLFLLVVSRKVKLNVLRLQDRLMDYIVIAGFFGFASSLYSATPPTVYLISYMGLGGIIYGIQQKRFFRQMGIRPFYPAIGVMLYYLIYGLAYYVRIAEGRESIMLINGKIIIYNFILYWGLYGILYFMAGKMNLRRRSAL